MAKSTCGSCQKIFKSVAGFDKHRTGSFGEAIYANDKRGSSHGKIIGHTRHTRRCMTTEEMLAIGMCQNDKGWWITSAYEQSAHADDANDETAAD